MFSQVSTGKTVKEAQEVDTVRQAQEVDTVRQAQEVDTVRQAMTQQIDTSGRHPSHLV